MSNLLPVELITEILYQLPVKSLLRFRCVSKPWCSLIDDAYFIKRHLNHSLKTNTNVSLILTDKDDLFSVELDTLDTAIKLNNPPIRIESRVIQVVGSCNGLVALSHPSLVLWSPSTRKYHIVPAAPKDNPVIFSKCIAYGFGCDSVLHDYKLVSIELYNCKDQELKKFQVNVYSLKSNSWRQTREFPDYHCCYPLGGGILANNNLHWKMKKLCERNSGNLIVGFDLQVEELFEVPQSDYMDTTTFMRLESLGGCLCVLCGNYNVNVAVDIWVMKEYGVKESWTKLFSMALTEDFGTVKPLAYSKSGDRVLLYADDADDDNDEKFVWYDLKRKRAEKLRIQGVPKSYRVSMCVASLVPLSGGQQVGGN